MRALDGTELRFEKEGVDPSALQRNDAMRAEKVRARPGDSQFSFLFRLMGRRDAFAQRAWMIAVKRLRHGLLERHVL